MVRTRTARQLRVKIFGSLAIDIKQDQKNKIITRRTGTLPASLVSSEGRPRSGAVSAAPPPRERDARSGADGTLPTNRTAVGAGAGLVEPGGGQQRRRRQKKARCRRREQRLKQTERHTTPHTEPRHCPKKLKATSFLHEHYCCTAVVTRLLAWVWHAPDYRFFVPWVDRTGL